MDEDKDVCNSTPSSDEPSMSPKPTTSNNNNNEHQDSLPGKAMISWTDSSKEESDTNNSINDY